MILFFINGALDIRTVNQETRYVMKFLTETDIETNMNITLQDDIGNDKEFSFDVTGLTRLEIDCTDFMVKFNWMQKTYVRVKYVVEVAEAFDIRGSFPIISNNHPGRLNIVSVSCNNNKAKNDTNRYRYTRVDRSENLWFRIANKTDTDVLVHAGNQIYGDYIVDNHIGYDYRRKSCNSNVVYNTYANLYRTAFGETYQGIAMRNSLNISVLGSHDIYPGFVNDNDDLNKIYHVSGMKAYVNYMHQLHTGFSSVSDVVAGKEPLYFNVKYGQQMIVGLDEYAERCTKDLFSEDQMLWLSEVLSSAGDNVHIVSARPIGDVSSVAAKGCRWFSEAAKEDLVNPNDIARTRLLLDVVGPFCDKDVVVLSGSSRSTFVSDILCGKSVISQVVCGPVSRTPCNSRWLDRVDWMRKRCGDSGVDGDVYVVDKSSDIHVINKSSLMIGNGFGMVRGEVLSNFFLDVVDMNSSDESDTFSCCWIK